MGYQKYKLTCWSDTYDVEADLSQASAPVIVDGDSTPFQTADFRHKESEMREGLAAWLYRDTPDCDDAADAAEMEAVEADED